MELVDVTDSKSVGGDIVWVRVPPPAPNKYNPNQIFRIGKGFGLFVYVLIGLSQQPDKLVFVEQSLASPYGRGAPNGGGEGPLSHGCAVTAPPKGEPRSLRDKLQFVGFSSF